MLRVIVRMSDAGAAAHVGGPVYVEHRTFDIEAVDLEAFMRAGDDDPWKKTEIVGVELMPATTSEEAE
jgi:hypothetical protein